MKDIYRELMVRSFKDAASVAETVEEKYEVSIPSEAYPQMAIRLYQHRVEKHRMDKMKAEQAAHMPEYPDDPDVGRY